MTKTKRDSTSHEEAFHKHYRAIWGERWDRSLYPALADSTRACALINKFAPISKHFASPTVMLKGDDLEELIFPPSDKPQKLLCLTRRLPVRSERASDSTTDQQRDIELSKDYSANDFSLMPIPERLPAEPQSKSLMTHWNLDAASALAVHLLDVQPDDKILDLCSAPGGKSIAIMQILWPQLHHDVRINQKPDFDTVRGRLHANEPDRARYSRLVENIRLYSPGLGTRNFGFTMMDGCTAVALHKGQLGYNKVLVDAPCSSERHIIHESSRDFSSWRPGSTKRLTQTQTELLMTGLRVVKTGGTVLYATCSIEMAENDGVVEKVLSLVEKEVKKGGKWSVKLGFNGGKGDEKLESELERDWAERTKFGWIVLPDHPSGGTWGPLYFAVLNKTRAPRKAAPEVDSEP